MRSIRLLGRDGDSLRKLWPVKRYEYEGERGQRIQIHKGLSYGGCNTVFEVSFETVDEPAMPARRAEDPSYNANRETTPEACKSWVGN